MKTGYIPSVKSATEFQHIIAMMNEVGVESEQISINQTFDEFIKTVNDGDVIVVYDLDYFSTLSELIDRTVEFSERGIQLESITDSWYTNSPDILKVLKGITELWMRIRTKRTKTGLQKARAQGKTLGRPIGTIKLKDKITEVTRLREKSNLSVMKACQIADCNPRSYYRHVKIKPQLKTIIKI